MNEILFTDLDHSLFQSAKYFDEEPSVANVASWRDEKRKIPYSYYNYEQVDLISYFSGNDRSIVPVTARSIEAYFRTAISDHSKYAIVAMGGKILIDGKIDKDWIQHVKDLEKKHNHPIQKIFERIKGFSFSALSFNLIEDFYIEINFNKEDDKFNSELSDCEQKISQFMTSLESVSYWRDENSACIYPLFIQKDSAVEYLIKKLNPTITHGRGDHPVFDKKFISLTDHATFVKKPKIKKGI